MARSGEASRPAGKTILGAAVRVFGGTKKGESDARLNVGSRLASQRLSVYQKSLYSLVDGSAGEIFASHTRAPRMLMQVSGALVVARMPAGLRPDILCG